MELGEGGHTEHTSELCGAAAVWETGWDVVAAHAQWVGWAPGILEGSTGPEATTKEDEQPRSRNTAFGLLARH